jgi:hypothetical protein
MRPIILVAGAAAAVAFFTITSQDGARAASATDPNAIVTQLTQRMDAVSSYKAHIRLSVHLHSFPFLAADLNGTTSYTRPGHYTVTFDSVPALADAFQKVSGDIGDPAAWRDKYAVAIDPSSAAAGPNTTVLRLTEKVKGQIDHALAYVDLPSRTVTRMEWDYVNGGRIAMEQHFAPIDGVLLVDTQAADIDMPGYKATAQAVFDGYSVQVGQTPSGRPRTSTR